MEEEYPEGRFWAIALFTIGLSALAFTLYYIGKFFYQFIFG
jgi:hypothetical protein